MTGILRNAARVLRGVYLLRIFIAVFSALFLAFSRFFLPQIEALSVSPKFFWFLLPSLVAVIFLFVPRLEQRMGKAYLPVALAIVILALSLEYATAYIHPGVRVVIAFRSGLELNQYWAPTEAILLVLIPCVLAGAVYGLRGAAIASSLASIIHLFLGVYIWKSGVAMHGFLILLPLRLAVLYGFPLMTGYIVETWQREHTALQQANRRLHGYTATIEQLATTRERMRLARDLHDTLAHTLSALVVQLEAVDALLQQDPTLADTQLKKAQEHARNGLEEARRTIMDLRSSPVDELGLPGALAKLVDVFNQNSGIQADFSLEGEPVPLSAVNTNALYRICQELLSNVERHADAGLVSVGLCYGDGITLWVRDDGRGFDPQTVDPLRMGLVGVRERVALIDGRIDIQSEPELGTNVVIDIIEPTV
ncbi:MAG: sensor histidine kinase [Anaerolineales bacterium]|nr:sensor histidine kinase [Anaerolineales bacterium]